MNAINLILGNGCSLLAMVTDSISATRKTAKGVLLVQSLSQLIYCIGTILLKGYSGAVQNVMSIVRNFVAMGRKKSSKWVEWGLVVAGVVLGVAFNNRGLAGWLPILGNLEYSLAVFRYRDDQRMLKIALIVSLIIFIAFNVVIGNIVGVVADSVVIVTTLADLWRTREKKDKTA